MYLSYCACTAVVDAYFLFKPEQTVGWLAVRERRATLVTRQTDRGFCVCRQTLRLRSFDPRPMIYKHNTLGAPGVQPDNDISSGAEASSRPISSVKRVHDSTRARIAR